MKHKRFFSILAAAVILSLLMVFIPAIPASATPIIVTDVEKAGIGEEVTVAGSGFLPSVPPDNLHDVDIYFSSDALDVGDELSYYQHHYELVKPYVYTDESGTFSKIIEIPAVLSDSDEDVAVHGGTYYFYVTYEGHDDIEAYAEFIVIGVNTVVPASGTVSTEVEMSGVGFDANDEVQVLYDGNEIGVSSGDRRFKSNGTFSSKVVIPASTGGAHTLTVVDEGGHSSQIQFTVEPEISLSPAPASANEEVTVRGTGFGENADIFVYFDGDIVYITGDYDTNSYGSFESSFLVPEVEPGTYLVEVEDEVFNLADADVEVGPSLTINPVTSTNAPGNIGDTIELSGDGFQPDYELTITYASDPVYYYTTSEADGSFEFSFTVPPSPAGEHIVSVSDQISTKEVSFFVESTSPEAPTPLLPEMDTEADSKATFDWTDVTDPSVPITYELQVATNSQFTTDSIVVNRIELTASTYTLTEDEELEEASAEAPYYWRVRAKDAASNQGNWSSGVRFTVGGGFSMPSWLIYTLIGIGVVLVFFLGIWFGRRPSGEEDYW